FPHFHPAGEFVGNLGRRNRRLSGALGLAMRGAGHRLSRTESKKMYHPTRGGIRDRKLLPLAPFVPF
ncbi:hypothetical protein Ancab_001175, partial [Ancistrocladus abbreviatus]